MSRIGEYKKHTAELPYSVKDSCHGAAKAYNDMIEAKSFDKRIITRQRTIDAIIQVHDNLQGLRDGIKVLPTPILHIAIQNTSIITRIYNWFLNIQY